MTVLVQDNYSDALIKEVRSLDNGGRKTFFDSWTIDYKLGGGNFGSVYRASKGPRERAAIKIVPVDLHGSDDFSKEVKILRQLNSPYIVDILDCDVISSSDLSKSFMVIRMELLHPIDKNNMSHSEVIKLARNICSALNTCHSTHPPILHRDIKPDNIMVSDTGVYKLGDFGAAWMLDGNKERKNYATPLYMPPEVAAHKSTDIRSDIYSFGLTLYTLFNNGRAPFSDSGDTSLSIKRRLSGELLPEIKGCSYEILCVLRRACAADPNMRYQNAAQLISALNDALTPNHRSSQSAPKAENPLKKSGCSSAIRSFCITLLVCAIIFTLFIILSNYI